MADLNLMRELATTAETKIVLLVMDGLGGLPREPGGPTEPRVRSNTEPEQIGP